MPYPVKGSCQCGGVSYQLLAEPLLMVACHCRQCQKLSTSAFSITAVVAADAVQFSGEMVEWSRTSDSGNLNNAKFCPTCGNRIYHFNPQDPGSIKLKPANLDDTSIIKPTMHIWVCEKQEWYTIPEGVDVYEKQADFKQILSQQ